MLKNSFSDLLIELIVEWWGELVVPSLSFLTEVIISAWSRKSCEKRFAYGWSWGAGHRLESCPAVLWHSGDPSPEIWLCTKLLAGPPGTQEIHRNLIKKRNVIYWALDIFVRKTYGQEKKINTFLTWKENRVVLRLMHWKKKYIHTINL